jgi:hypothetical protein
MSAGPLPAAPADRPDSSVKRPSEDGKRPAPDDNPPADAKAPNGEAVPRAANGRAKTASEAGRPTPARSGTTATESRPRATTIPPNEGGTEVAANGAVVGENAEVAPAADDGWALLEGLRRRIDDQGMQARTTHQQVTQLTESIAALVEIQRRRTRGINLNSFVAYLIFTVLCGAGFYFLYQSRANELVDSRESAVRERDAAHKRAEELAAAKTAREQADTRAWEVYQLLESGKRSEATAKLDALRDLPLSRTERAILAARAHETQVMEVDAALKAATASFKAGRHQDVIAPLEAALVHEPTGARAASMRYFLGIAYAKAGTLDKAVAYLQQALDADVEHDDARFQLASALDRAGAYARARAEYDRFATAFPQSQFTGYATRRSAALARLPANAPPADAKPPTQKPPDPPKPVPPAPKPPEPAKQPAAKPADPPKPAPSPAPAPVEPVPESGSAAP